MLVRSCRALVRAPRRAAASSRLFSTEDDPRPLGTRYIDIRSDTVTKPTPQMSIASMDAPLGDDVFGEDPTVKKLEKFAAKMFGKESALFVPSGTMANLICVAVHCGRGDEVILGTESHIFNYELGGVSTLMGIPMFPVPNNTDGTLPLDLIRRGIKADNVHYARTKLVALENTQNRCGGRVLSPQYVASVASLCRENGLALHMDGARIMNAAVALNLTGAELAADVDSISVCLSKGLGAPVGSLVISSAPFVNQARRLRKMLGGGMRQAGVLAAHGLVVLDHHVEKLPLDHQNAKSLARGLSSIRGVSIEGGVDSVETNIMFVRLGDEYGVGSAAKLSARLKQEHNILINAYGDQRLRAVTHHQVKSVDIEKVVAAVEKVLKTFV